MTQYYKLFTEEESAVVREIQFYPDKELLEIRLEPEDQEPRVYFYEEFKKEDYLDFLMADSKGSYYNEKIKGEYPTFVDEID